MTVGELIEELKQFDGSLNARLAGCEFIDKVFYDDFLHCVIVTTEDFSK